MKRNTLFNLLLAFGVLLILSSGITMAPGALAQGPEPQGDVGAQAAVGTAFTYPGLPD